MRLLKTMHVDSEMQWSGGQRQVSGLCRYLRERGHEVQIVCRPGSKLEAWAQEQSLTAFPVEMRPIVSVSAVLRMRSVIKREKPDVVHLHASRAHVLGSAAARLAGAPVVVVTRRMDEPIRMIWPNTSAYGAWTTAIVAISQAVRKALVSCGVDEGKIRVIPSGVDVETFANATPDPELRTSLSIEAGTPIICTAAGLVERKGIRYLIEAAAQLVRPAHVLIAGEGEQHAELETLARNLDVAASFLGFRQDMPRLIASSDIFVMPALLEGLGVAAIEAMAAGKPVVASAVGGLAESVIDGETGFLIPPRDSRALADALNKLVLEPETARRFGEAGQARARTNYSLETMAARNEALYFELLGE